MDVAWHAPSEPPAIEPSYVEGAVARGSMSRVDDLMERYAEGDDGAFSDLFDALEPRLRRFVIALCSNDAFPRTCQLPSPTDVCT